MGIRSVEEDRRKSRGKCPIVDPIWKIILICRLNVMAMYLCHSSALEAFVASTYVGGNPDTVESKSFKRPLNIQILYRDTDIVKGEIILDLH